MTPRSAPRPGDRAVFGPPVPAEGPPPDLLGPPWGEGRRAVLRVRPAALRAALVRDAPAPARAAALLPWLSEQVHAWRERPDAGLLVPSVAELTFLQRRVAEPLARGAAEDQALAARLAPLVDAAVWRIDECGVAPADGGPGCLALAAGGELLVLGPDRARTVIEAVRVHDEAGTWRLAAEIFRGAHARALLISIGRAGVVATPFTQTQALHQALADPDAPRTIVQLRGLAPRPGASDALAISRLRSRGAPAIQLPASDAAVSPVPTASPIAAVDPRGGSSAGVWRLLAPVLAFLAPTPAPLPTALQDILGPAGPLGWVPRWRLLEEVPELAALVGVRDPLLGFTAAFTADEAIVLWLPPALRRPYAVPDPCLELRRLAALGLLPPERECSDWLRDETAIVRPDPPPVPTDARPDRASRGPMGHAPSTLAERAAAPSLGFSAALAELEAYAEGGNLHRLRLVLADVDLRLAAGLGRATARGFLGLCERAPAGRCAIVWLGPALPGHTSVALAPGADDPGLERALWRRTRTLLLDRGAR